MWRAILRRVTNHAPEVESITMTWDRDSDTWRVSASTLDGDVGVSGHSVDRCLDGLLRAVKKV